jgi:FMN reductase
MSHIVFIAGSPSPSSRSSFVAGAIAAEVEAAGLSIRTFSLRDFDPGDVFHARADAPAIAAFIRTVTDASGLVLSTPTYKGTYAGGLKAIVDAIPPDALVNKVTLGLATARIAAHAAGVERGFRDLFAFFRARALDSLFVRDEELAGTDGRFELSADAAQRVRAAAAALIAGATGRG